MITTSLYRQKDIRWTWTRLGFSSYTIGGFGCTITSICNLLSVVGVTITPPQLNGRLMAVNGYAPDRTGQRCLVIWSKVVSLFPQLKSVWRGYNYDNTAVLASIKKGMPALVEVQLGAYRHWVLFVGDKLMVDPLRSVLKKQEFTSKYPVLTGYCLFVRS
jgi:hypothetical protein